jgi:hypothetical protein
MVQGAGVRFKGDVRYNKFLLSRLNVGGKVDAGKRGGRGEAV